MPYYRFFFTDDTGQIVGHALVEQSDDEHAARYADKLLAGSKYPGIEVWTGPRKFYQKMKSRDKSS